MDRSARIDKVVYEVKDKSEKMELGSMFLEIKKSKELYLKVERLSFFLPQNDSLSASERVRIDFNTDGSLIFSFKTKH